MPRFQLSKPIGIFYEHRQWFLPLFDKLNEQGIPYVPIDARSHSYDPRETEDRYSLFFNRMSAAAYLRGHGNAILYTLNYLAHVERSGIPIVNGRTSFVFEKSKALQLSLFEKLNVRYPASSVINSTKELSRAARKELQRVTNVNHSAAGYENFQQWLAGTPALALEDYSVSNRGLRPGLVGTAASVAEAGGRF